MIKKTISIMAFTFLSGCATQYQSSSLTGGHAEADGYGNLLKVYFFGNGYTTPEKSQQFLLYRCAEIAKKNNKKHFLIFNTLFDSANNESTKIPHVESLMGKPTAHTFVLFIDDERKNSFDTEKTLDALKTEDTQK